MANVYTNYKAKLSTNALTTIYTVPAETTTIVKSIRVSNEDTENNCNVSLFLVDTSSVSYSLEIDRPIEAKRSQELLATGNMSQDTSDGAVAASAPLVVKESEVIKAQAQNGNDLSIIISVLEISNT
jgi:hypothetical protein